MKKLFNNALSYLMVPALFVGYYFTHNVGLLFIYGLLSALVFLMFITLFIVHNVMKQSDNDAYKKMVSAFPDRRPWVISLSIQIATFIFLVYESCFFLAALVFINAALSQLWVHVMRSAKNELG